MGIKYASGSITGRSETLEYNFVVDTGATWVGIPQADIDALALDVVPNAGAALMTADGTVRRSPIYIAIGMIEGTGFVNGAVPAAVPLVGTSVCRIWVSKSMWSTSGSKNVSIMRLVRLSCCNVPLPCPCANSTGDSK